MQGIYKNFELYTHDRAWTVILDLVQDRSGSSSIEDALEMIRCSGDAWIIQ